MIDHASDKISEFLKNKYPDEMPSKGIIKYSIKFILSNIIPIILILVIASIMGEIKEVGTALLGFSILRMFSGGFHLKSAVVCIFTSIAMIFAITGTGRFVGGLDPYLMAISLILIFLYAPSNIKKQTRIAEKNFIYLKIISILIVTSNIFIGSTILTVSFFVQSVLLIDLKGGEK